jgi:hypothetical protein
MSSFPTKIGMYDPLGAFFLVSLEDGGIGFDITPASPPTPPPNPPVVDTAAITLTLAQTVEWAKRFIGNRSTAIGNGLQPAIKNANIILQTILGAPFAWRWNRIQTGFICAAGVQDYYLFNWTPQTPVAVGYLTVDAYGNSQQVLVAGTTGTSTPSWNDTQGGTTPDGTGSSTATWINLGNLNVNTSINYSFGWIEGAAVYNPNGANGSYFWEVSPKLWLSQTSELSRPRNVSAQLDNGSGNITFRLTPVPDSAYPVILTIQQKPGLFTKLGQTWSPIPDEYSRLYDLGFLALLLLYADDPRFVAINQQFVAQMLGANEGLTETQKNIFLNNWSAVTGQPIYNQAATNQGFQARQTGG